MTTNFPKNTIFISLSTTNKLTTIHGTFSNIDLAFESLLRLYYTIKERDIIEKTRLKIDGLNIKKVIDAIIEMNNSIDLNIMIFPLDFHLEQSDPRKWFK